MKIAGMGNVEFTFPRKGECVFFIRPLVSLAIETYKPTLLLALGNGRFELQYQEDQRER